MVKGSAFSNRDDRDAFVAVCGLRMRIKDFSRWPVSLCITTTHPPPLTIVDHLNLGTVGEAATICEDRSIPLLATFSRFRVHVANASQRFAVFRYRGPDATSGHLWARHGDCPDRENRRGSPPAHPISANIFRFFGLRSFQASEYTKRDDVKLRSTPGVSAQEFPGARKISSPCLQQ